MEHELQFYANGAWQSWHTYQSDLFAADTLRDLRQARPQRQWRIVTYYERSRA